MTQQPLPPSCTVMRRSSVPRGRSPNHDQQLTPTQCPGPPVAIADIPNAPCLSIAMQQSFVLGFTNFCAGQLVLNRKEVKCDLQNDQQHQLAWSKRPAFRDSEHRWPLARRLAPAGGDHEMPHLRLGPGALLMKPQGGGNMNGGQGGIEQGHSMPGGSSGAVKCTPHNACTECLLCGAEAFVLSATFSATPASSTKLL